MQVYVLSSQPRRHYFVYRNIQQQSLVQRGLPCLPTFVRRESGGRSQKTVRRAEHPPRYGYCYLLGKRCIASDGGRRHGHHRGQPLLLTLLLTLNMQRLYSWLAALHTRLSRSTSPKIRHAEARHKGLRALDLIYKWATGVAGSLF